MSNGSVIAETERLIIRELTQDDAAFVLELINSPKFHQYIGDRGVRTVDEARDYIGERYSAKYRELGYGLYAICLKDGTPIGNCGFVRRDTLPGPDLGFALLPEFEGLGYGIESGKAVMDYGRRILGFSTVYAITTLDNSASVRLLEKLGFEFKEIVEVGDETLNLFFSSPLDEPSK